MSSLSSALTATMPLFLGRVVGFSSKRARRAAGFLSSSSSSLRRLWALSLLKGSLSMRKSDLTVEVTILASISEDAIEEQFDIVSSSAKEPSEANPERPERSTDDSLTWGKVSRDDVVTSREACKESARMLAGALKGKLAAFCSTTVDVAELARASMLSSFLFTSLIRDYNQVRQRVIESASQLYSLSAIFLLYVQ
jgi:hypothetical protein